MNETKCSKTIFFYVFLNLLSTIIPMLRVSIYGQQAPANNLNCLSIKGKYERVSVQSCGFQEAEALTFQNNR